MKNKIILAILSIVVVGIIAAFVFVLTDKNIIVKVTDINEPVKTASPSVPAQSTPSQSTPAAQAGSDEHDHDHANDEEAYKKAIKKVEEFEASPAFKPEILLADIEGDIIYGDKTAPVRIVEYASLSCGACKGFYEVVLPELKEKLLDNKKAYLVYRHYPLNRPALEGAAIASCIPDAEKRKSFIGDLFKTQENWAYVKNESEMGGRIRSVSKPYLSEAEFSKCYANEALQTSIIKNMKDAADGLMIQGTPSLYINGKRFVGSGKDAFIEEVEALSAAKK